MSWGCIYTSVLVESNNQIFTEFPVVCFSHVLVWFTVWLWCMWVRFLWPQIKSETLLVCIRCTQNPDGVIRLQITDWCFEWLWNTSMIGKFNPKDQAESNLKENPVIVYSENADTSILKNRLCLRGQNCNSFLNYWAANQSLSTIFVQRDFSIRNSIKTTTDGNSWTYVAAGNTYVSMSQT